MVDRGIYEFWRLKISYNSTLSKTIINLGAKIFFKEASKILIYISILELIRIE